MKSFPHFGMCSNITKMVLEWGVEGNVFNLNLLPQSIKKLKIRFPLATPQMIPSGFLELDSLIVEGIGQDILNQAEYFITKITCRVLVLIVNKHENSNSVNTNDFIDFIVAHKDLVEKLVVFDDFAFEIVVVAM
jgi:hypothetical protein